MPGFSLSSSSDCDARKKVDYFQRRKVGSIRDNPKLMKIRQQFENASKTEKEVGSVSSSFSLSLSKCPKDSVLATLLKTNEAKLLQADISQNRRHSEGEITDRGSFSVYGSKKVSLPSDGKPNSFPSHTNSGSPFEIKMGACDSYSSRLAQSSETKYDFQNSSCDSGVNTNSSASEEDMSKSKMSTESLNKFSFICDVAPPIPRRGISPAVQGTFMKTPWDSNNSLLLKELDVNSNVQKAIDLYEGMSFSEEKTTTAKSCTNYQKILRKEDRRSRGPHCNSRRNSFRKSKFTGELPTKRTHKENREDKTQGIYQTLSTTLSTPQILYDPYDRLNRVHDVVNHIHKGQPSTCAACKAIPASVLQLQDTESPFLEVKCTEAAPHHHPPCICFSCQHSVFSCSTPATPAESLYYNVCCLNLPNRESSWRQSRRRPVCEQNGRLCIVNCDNSTEDCYLSESPTQPKCFMSESPMQPKEKQTIGDSCESDEGWVDVTDSEDEKSTFNNGRGESFSSETLNNSLSGTADDFIIQDSWDINDVVTKCGNLKLSFSTEHLYESIADIDSGEKQEVSNDSIYSSKCENDLDSGEWSTESPSPVFNEPNQQQKVFLNRFTVNYESQAKKTFMKSVLGKKVTNPKKRRMSNFFVPWLVSNNEYGSPNSNGPKTCAKKQGSRQAASSAKTKRSHSMSLNSQKLNANVIFCSTDLLNESSNKSGESDSINNNLLHNQFLSPDINHSITSRGSVASSAYLRADQLQSTETPRRKVSLPSESGATDVSIERICRRSSSGNSEHSYILFKPIKEEEVPLYQFYERNIKERVSYCRSPKSLSPIMWSSIPENISCSEAKTPFPQLSVVEQLSPDAADMKMLWCELPEVKESGILERISAKELKLQEAIFEFIQSQASYMRSLKVLYENFIQTPEFSDIESPVCVLSKHEQDVLFSDIIRLKEVSERILCEITARWSDGILIPDICDIINHHAQLPTFSVYVKYCSNRVYQERTLKELKESRLCFLEALRKLESNPICQGLSLESFLFLPMQHIARLPLLLDNIFRWLVDDSPSYTICKSALEAVHKVFVECNEGARKMERLEEMFVLNKQLEFKECKVLPLISASRWLLKKGELMKLEFDKKTFGRSNRCVRVPVFIFLFNDLLVITKRKNDDCYTVMDYCARDKVQATAINAKDLQQPLIAPNICRYLIYLKLLSNHQGVAVDMILNCTLLSERTRWIEAIHSVLQNKPCEVWEYDCPQVQCFKSYIAQQPDELSLQESDVVTIHRKMNDGWYEGRRLRDGLQGWFPASYTMDIPCSRARASNLRQCYRLLMLSHTN